ncbi:MAG: AbrB/MazE/SpoVT family DNA-binding domain-containing protein [Candidatus Heimdallarchaeota archaeon]
MIKVKVTRNAQITIPKAIREKLGIVEGDILIVREQDHRILIEKLETDIWADPGGFLPENFEDIQKKMRQDTLKRLKRLGIVE